METITLEKDIKILYVTVKSFPDGKQETTYKLYSIVPFSAERKYISVSRSENGGGIVYRAGAEEMKQGEAQKFNCDTLVLKNSKILW